MILFAVVGCQHTETPLTTSPSDDPIAAIAPVAAGDLPGLTPVEIDSRLGPAAFQRLDGPAAFWRYQNTYCALDLFFYRETGAEALTVHHVSARTELLGAVPTQACIDTLQDQRPESASS